MILRLSSCQWDLKPQPSGGYTFASAFEGSVYAGYQEEEEADPIIVSKTPRDWLLTPVQDLAEHFQYVKLGRTQTEA